MDDTDFDFLCQGLSAAEAKRMRKILAEWSDGDENGFPVQLVMLTRAQWRAAALVPQAVNESRKLIERHLAEYRQQTAALVANFSEVGEEQTEALGKILKTHTEALHQASGSFRDQLRSIGANAMDIRKHLDDGASAFYRLKEDLKTETTRFHKSCQELNDHVNGLQLKRDWLAFFGLIAFGVVIGMVLLMALDRKWR